MLGHSFKNFTVKKKFDCHVKCFDEKWWCQAYQMWNNRREIVDEDKSSTPKDFINADGYRKFDMNREYVTDQASPLSNQAFTFHSISIETDYWSISLPRSYFIL